MVTTLMDEDIRSQINTLIETAIARGYQEGHRAGMHDQVARRVFLSEKEIRFRDQHPLNDDESYKQGWFDGYEEALK